ncbi:MAG TPA: CmcI family methyltransferase [Pyrinomonadaceae bacterium]|nr:CmcI family methyltransferase [Pyrinomonadaceae bacterium]
MHQPRAKSPAAERRITSEFHKQYFYAKEKTWKNNTFWMNVPVAKCPLDLWVYQEIINETKPDVIIETGTAYGGSALFLASISDLVGRGRVVTIDIQEQSDRPEHARIQYLSGSSTAEEIVAGVSGLIRSDERVMVILDSDHRAEHVQQELEIYSRFASVGCYLIVEDTNINGHPVMPLHGAGPMEAVEHFMKAQEAFVIDAQREKFYLTFNPKGYLKRIK